MNPDDAGLGPPQLQTAPDVRRYWPLGQLVLARLREFYREPAAIFWVYGFPLLTVVALGAAFRNKPVEQITVDVEQGPGASDLVSTFQKQPTFDVHTSAPAEWRGRLRTGKTQLAVVPPRMGTRSPAEPKASDDPQGGSIATSESAGESGAYEYWFDPTRAESVLARNTVDDVVQRAAGRRDPALVENREYNEPGGRYVDFLIPGLLGMSLMGGGLWGVGFVTVDMRIRKLLKRFLATPMRKTDFLGGLMVSRLIFLVPEVLVLLVFARVAFGVVNHGSVAAVTALVLLGAFSFAGIGLLVASRATTIETVSGLMNLVMLPMWILSGIFFSSERFPAAAQPFVQALPLTPLINALRAVMQEGAPLATQWPEVAVLSAWGLGTFFLALKLFRWN